MLFVIDSGRLPLGIHPFFGYVVHLFQDHLDL
jgi:hypothetical protein